MLEVRIYSELKYFFPNIIWQYPFNRGHLDVFIPDYNIAIEIDGFWHTNKENRDIKKQENAKNSNIKIIRIRDVDLPKINNLHIYHDWKNKQSEISTICELVQMLLSELNLDNHKRIQLSDYIKNNIFVNELFFLDTWANQICPTFNYA